MINFNAIKESAYSILGSVDPWIGFKKIGNTWKHASNIASNAQIHPWNATLDTKSEIYLIFNTDNDNWDVESDQNSDINPSICELVTADDTQEDIIIMKKDIFLEVSRA